MTAPLAILVLLYLVGALVGVLFTDDRLRLRIVLGLLWPIGPIAFVVTVLTMLAAGATAYPLAGLAAAVVLVVVLILVW